MEEARRLLANGADVNATRDNSTSLYEVCAYRGGMEVTEFLVQAGADVNARNDDQRTPLHGACTRRENKEKFVEFLLHNGADPNARDKNQKTPLYDACRGGELEIARLLLKAGADPNAKDKDGCTPLHAFYWRESMEEERIRAVEAGDEDDDAFYYEEHKRVGAEGAEILLLAGANPDLGDNEEYTPLHWVCMLYNSAAMLGVLLKGGADVNAQNLDMETPLHEACNYGSLEAVRALVQAGARVNQADKRDNTPLDSALHREDDKIQCVALLLEAGADAFRHRISKHPVDYPSDEATRRLLYRAQMIVILVAVAYKQRCINVDLIRSLPEYI